MQHEEREACHSKQAIDSIMHTFQKRGIVFLRQLRIQHFLPKKGTNPVLETLGVNEKYIGNGSIRKNWATIINNYMFHLVQQPRDNPCGKDG